MEQTSADTVSVISNSTAISKLTKIYAEREIAPRSARPLIGLTSNTVPWELLRAAGFDPILLDPPLAETHALRYMEPVFSTRMKAIFQFLISAKSNTLRAVVIPRTSEQEHKLYLYLREVLRQGDERPPQPILYNLLHAQSAEAQTYGLERTLHLKETIERLAGRPVSVEALTEAINEGNAARQAIRELLELRQSGLTASEALPLIGACYYMDRGEYTRLLRQAIVEIKARAPLSNPIRPRILIKGSPANHPDLHAAIEAAGAIVVAEDDWWGSRAAGSDIATTSDPMRAIFEKYYFDAPSPRVYPSSVADQWFLEQATQVDGVIFYLPDEDDVLGWDYPRLRACLDQRRIPHLMVRAINMKTEAKTINTHLKPFVEGLPHG